MKKIIALTSVASMLLSAAPAFAATVPPAPKKMVNITPSGSAQLSGTLKSMATNSIVVTSWGGDWTVNINPDSKFLRKSEGKSVMAEMAVGDAVSVEGKANTTGLFTIDARKVRDHSIEASAELRGTISNLSATTFTLTTKNKGNVQVTVKSDAKIKLDGEASMMASLANGMTVSASGVWNARTATLLASKVNATSIKEVTVKLNPQNSSGEMGMATLKSVEGKTKVTVRLSGAPEGVSQPAHIHTGSCAIIGGVKYPLNALVNGRSETMIETSLSNLRSMLPLALNVHKSDSEVGVYVACGDLK